MGRELFRVEGLRLHYSTPRGMVRAVDGVSFSLSRGEALGIVGESGSGKTSLAISIMRLLPRNVALHEGKVFLEGFEILSIPEEEFRRSVRWRKISMVFQGAMNALNPVLRVGFQVAEPLSAHLDMDRGIALELASGLLRMVGIPSDFSGRYPHELSGGMKQRVVIAMALALDPALIILDEPTSALDVSVQAQITNLLKRLKREKGLAMIFITHDIALASEICDRIAVMYAGQIVEVDEAEQVIWSPKHPYTSGLLASVPRLSSEEPPESIGGAPPDLTHPPAGCRFHPRCPYAFGRCASQEPPDFDADGGGSVKCWLYGGRFGGYR